MSEDDYLRAAMAEAAFDKRPWMSMPRHDRERYVQRVKIVAAALHENDPETPDQALDRWLRESEA